ncbi:glycosyl hydrolase 115 family protein [Catenovulum sp. 2E275]|uniref:glycosyl hydrolase 115 family protein n=1 Tax=Catenovulum sp. 2E275 TaxID=2980497 RepID=UPI0021CE8326|nr:glycosyl hydrolase 115 family protein [Catenovulum sp. 2E275]MCU4676774.1 glycosyl hydrolase 115 family protein [Catenovulum sp. 2E275]
MSLRIKLKPVFKPKLALISGLIASVCFVSGCGDNRTVQTAENKANADLSQPAEQLTDFTIISDTQQQTVYIDPNTDPLIKWAAQALIDDIKALSGKTLALVETESALNKGIYIGQLSDQLMNHTELKAHAQSNELISKWEHFEIQADKNQLTITGSDVRGTVYGIFELSEKLGISPWRWWADVTPQWQEQVSITLPQQGLISGPSVQYRGIFLNDEDWGLQPWAEHTFEPEVGDIGPKTYEKIFQLLLRLKANTIWPAMHPSTQAFYAIDGNQQMAQQYHIVIGTSHAEPMLRNNVDEWDKKTLGEYNYFTNSETINQYWQQRIEQVKGDKDQFIATLGMRGIHDSHMEGAESIEDSIGILDDIISTQRKMLSTTLAKPAENIPQTFIPYKEVLELYNNGLKVPDDVTLMWTDDNYGYIRRLSNKQEQLRAGGSGVYYHLSYWGRPHDYLWLSTTQPGLIWFEMARAYANGAQKMWIANVGDIKPAEYNMEFFLDLAWDINSIQHDSIEQYMQDWAAREFGQSHSAQIAALMNEYYRLASLRKPEYMGWSQTEPTRETKLTEFSKAEADKRLAAYHHLVAQVDQLAKHITAEKQDAWFQLVAYPVKAAAAMNEKFIYRQFAVNATQPADGAQWRAKATAAYQTIVELTNTYNDAISKGKWQKMMSMQPRNLPVFKAPEFDLAAQPEPNIASDAIYRQASEYSKKHDVDGFNWQSIESLGYSDRAITLLPLENVYFETEQPWLEYQLDLTANQTYQLELRFLPTHANQFDHQIKVFVNEQPLGQFDLNTKGRSEAWKINTLRNSQNIYIPLTAPAEGSTHIRIQVNQTGIVLDQLAVYPAEYQPSYEIPLQK